eukprot:CAMPEP_0184689134 /NCGR_PEP_ID=MMETSP0312-20130426/30486_1 /TAXON_ID=31354 /ORGANISM="Compsopogon coeruleus, Strain SAG 36.94" /LENGTH=363 /DNA_ID=CAMNT_0027146449 /DNA_START=63 /DNA_END=1154 /DNA_ORIENTATION=+
MAGTPGRGLARFTGRALDGEDEAAVGREWGRDAYLSEPRLGAIKVELCLECTGLPNMDLLSLSDPFAVLYEARGVGLLELGRTETVWDDLNPKFVRCFVLNSRPGVTRNLRVEVYDRDSNTESLESQDFLGCASFTLEDVFNQQDRKLRMRLTDGPRGKKLGFLIALINDFNDSVVDEIVEFKLNSSQLTRRGIFGSLIAQFFVISRCRLESTGRRTWTPVYRSEVKRRACSTGRLRFDVAAMNLQALNNGDLKTALRIEFFIRERTKAHDLLGYVDLTLEMLHLMSRRAEDRRIPIEGMFQDQRVGYFVFKDGRMGEDLRSTFEMNFDFISGGRYTSNNLAPSRRSSANRSDSAVANTLEIL